MSSKLSSPKAPRSLSPAQKSAMKAGKADAYQRRLEEYSGIVRALDGHRDRLKAIKKLHGKDRDAAQKALWGGSTAGLRGAKTPSPKGKYLSIQGMLPLLAQMGKSAKSVQECAALVGDAIKVRKLDRSQTPTVKKQRSPAQVAAARALGDESRRRGNERRGGPKQKLLMQRQDPFAGLGMDF